MGKPIVYCQGCGHNLREEEFSQGRAAWVDGLPLCAACRPKPAEVPTPSRATPRRVPASPRRSAPPPRPRPLLYAVGAASGIAVLVALVAAVGGRPAASPRASNPLPAAPSETAEAPLPDRSPPREPPPDARLDDLLQNLRKLSSEDPSFARRLEAMAMFESARKAAGPREGEVDRMRGEYEKGFDDAARRVAEFTLAEANRLAASKKYEEALSKIEAFPGAFAATAHAAPLAALRRDLAAKVEAAVRLRARPRHEASHVWQDDTMDALSDGKLPKASGDTSIPRFTWWDRKGSTEWVSWTFETPRKVSACEVYWFDDTGSGGCRVPASWKVFYLDGEAWREVRGAAGYGVERDRFNRATFEGVETWALKVEVLLQADASGGVLEWRVE